MYRLRARRRRSAAARMPRARQTGGSGVAPCAGWRRPRGLPAEQFVQQRRGVRRHGGGGPHATATPMATVGIAAPAAGSNQARLGNQQAASPARRVGGPAQRAATLPTMESRR